MLLTILDLMCLCLKFKSGIKIISQIVTSYTNLILKIYHCPGDFNLFPQ